MSARSTCLPLGVAAVLALSGWVCGAMAQVTLDGTANPAFEGSLAGPDYQIRAELGRRAGRNLFHSFERFSLATGERATFSGPDQIRNVISRVTGGTRSDIDGTLRSTIPGADLYFLNPAGIVFGPNASLDLQGSFHVSTADELRFADGTRFSASSPAASSFTVAAPEAFGFLRAAPGGIIVDRSTLEVPGGETFSLIGGDITIDGGSRRGVFGTKGIVRAEAGRIMLVALRGPGEASLAGGDPEDSAGTDIRLERGALVDASGSGGGTIQIRSGQFLASGLSFVRADNAGATDASTGIALDADAVRIESRARVSADALGSGGAGRVVVTAGNVTLRNEGQISSGTFGEGDAGTVVLTADAVTVRRESTISGATFGEGDAGTVVVTADDVTLRDNGVITSQVTGFAEGDADAGSVVVTADRVTLRDGGFIVSFTGQGGGGRVVVTADDLTLRDAGAISSATFGEGDAGRVVVTADNVTVGQGSGIGSDAFGDPEGNSGDAGTVVVTANNVTVRDFGRISSETIREGDAGRVVVTADNVTLLNGGSIGSGTVGAGDAGRVVVTADRLMIRDRGSINSLADTTFSASTGDAGGVTARARVIEVRDGGTISSAAFSDGSAGRISVSADRLLLDRGEITTSSASAGGGEIRVTVEDVIVLRSSAVTTSVAGGADPTAGNILIDPKALVIDGSRIQANALTGTGGNIEIIADNILVPEGDLEGLIARGDMSASGETEVDSGLVAISAPEVDISGGLVVLDAALLDAASQLRQRCAARRDIGASSLTGVGRGGLPLSPDGPLLSAYVPQLKPSAIDIDERDQAKAAPGVVTLALPCRGPA
ncbi:MAG TPA: filamentous hemagglutinin N-terminal domain-containing protein [Geminicoccaceae bacterium]|nr:filamentous hemagglutinin N-terminal domain-containing protein [Geminicoccaceae bacterium]